MNKFADLSSAEFAKYMNFKKHAPKVRDVSKFLARVEANPIRAPGAIDWRAQGVVNEVKDQGQCGSCWAFSAVSAFESAYAISTGNLIHLSEQQVVDCDIYGLDMGCDGGFMDQVRAERLGCCTLRLTPSCRRLGFRVRDPERRVRP